LSVVGCAIDGATGELDRRRLTPNPVEIFSWVSSLPGPVRVVYEAGPTGFGLARFLRERGVDCLVAAPSKLQRPAGDRVKTDARDALHLARLLKLARSSRSRSPPSSRKPPGIWSALVRTLAAT